VIHAVGLTYCDNILSISQDAMKCFWKAHCVGDIEGGIALLKLARLYERTNEADQAAAAYTQYIQVGGWVILREVLPC
jgi:anaphase-promoting complex subunit 8